MGFRLLAFVPLAALITIGILISASSIVSALETTFVFVPNPVVEIHRYESDCDRLRNEIDEISQAATACDQDVLCLGSPIICPIAMDEKAERDYLTLREELKTQCGVSFPLSDVSQLMLAATDACPSTADWMNSSRWSESREPGTFVF